MRGLAAAFPLLLCACLRETPIGSLDAGVPRTALSITGSTCTTALPPTAFPLKVMFLVDQSGSMCISDPPGSQGGSGFCQTAGVTPPGVTVPARIRMLQAALAQLRQNPSARVSLVSWEQNAKKAFPHPTTASVFGDPNDPSLAAEVGSLQTQLGTGGDLQGALEMARMLIQSDIDRLRNNDPASLPRTRYQIVLITDGSPSPRCSSVDGAGPFASAADPTLRWADSDPTFCNTVAPTDPNAITGFAAGGDRNQNDQLFAALDALKATAALNRVGDLKLHTLLVTNAETIAACGAICSDLYPADSSNPNRVEAARVASRWLFGELARRFEGSLREFQDHAGLSVLATVPVDATTLHSPSVLRGLYVQPLSAARSGTVWELDSDGDGLADSTEAAASPATRFDVADTDGDGFSDLYESTHRSLGFDPLLRDTRGCDPAAPATLNCVLRDTDGDGLTQFAENWLSSRSFVVDSDGDAIPDGLETVAGLDPAAPDLTDGDGDGVLDGAEVQLGTDPRAADNPRSNPARLSVGWTLTTQDANSACYDFTLDNLPLQAPDGQPAYFKVWVGEGPAGVPRDEGVWKVACARTLRVGDANLPPDLLLAGLHRDFFLAPEALPSPRETPGTCLTPANFPVP